MAHRVAWELIFGSPGDKFVCHKCDNPGCVRPSHLFLGTAKDNCDDMHKKGRDRHLKHEQHPCAKVTWAQVLAIRASTDSHKVMAARFGISYRAVRAIRSFECWVV